MAELLHMELLSLNFLDRTTIFPWAFLLFGLNQQVETGQSYLSPADQPAGRSANAALQFKVKECSVAEEHIYCKFLSWDLEREKHMLWDG